MILTVPLGCLQRSTITFNPPLPPRVQSAIDNLGFGNLEKLFLKFKRAWWTTHLSEDPPSYVHFSSSSHIALRSTESTSHNVFTGQSSSPRTAGIGGISSRRLVYVSHVSIVR